MVQLNSHLKLVSNVLIVQVSWEAVQNMVREQQISCRHMCCMCLKPSMVDDRSEVLTHQPSQKESHSSHVFMLLFLLSAV